MGQVRVAAFSVSLDGFGAGPEQSLQNPLGKRGPELHGWFTSTKSFKTMFGAEGGTEGIDNDYAHRSMDGFGAFILGRNMFAHSRGAWTDDGWKGWWGENPPFHVPVFVRTHDRRESLEMEGGTTFHFVQGSAREVLALAVEAAGGQDVRIGGGPSTVREYLGLGLIDELHVAVVPILLGDGVRLWDDLRGLEKSYSVSSEAAESGVVHITFRRTA